MRVFTTIATLLALAPLAGADTKPPPQLQEIKKLVGKWGGKGSLQADGKTHAVAMTYDCVDSAGSAGVRCKCVITGIPGFTYQFDDLWGYSASDKLVHWYTVTNAGEVHDHRGHFDANGGQLSVEELSDGKVLSEVITFKRKPKAMTMSWVTNIGGAVHQRGDIDLVMK
jgi:hypothetical protein